MKISSSVAKENWHEDFIAHIAETVKPEVYVELGLYQCELFNKIVPLADELYGVDINPDAGKFMQKSAKTFFHCGTTDSFVKIFASQNKKIDLLFIDADHCKESVLQDFWNYFPYVSDHGLILLHDTHPKNLQYTDKGYCGDAYLVVEELKNHSNEFEFMTIPVHPGLTLIRKRRTQLRWDKNLPASNSESMNIGNQVNKSISMPAFVAKVKQMLAGNNEIRNIVEIGALDAHDSQYFKQMFPDANVYAIEALPENYEQYMKGTTGIIPINAVVSDKDGVVDFYRKKLNGIHSIFDRGNEYGGEILKLKSYRLETLAAEFGIKSVDLLKLDVEGATIEVLEGMGSLLNDVKIMHIESESFPFFKGQKLHNEVISFLGTKGFSMIELTSFPIQPGRLQYDSVWINNKYLDKNTTAESELTENVLGQNRYRIVCITQIFNEMKKGNLERFWKYLQPVVDGLVVYDDGSTDGSYEFMLDKAIFVIKGGENDFNNEINHKKVLLETALQLKPDFILWLDADEVLSADAAEELQNICSYAVENKIDGISFHEVNLWRSNSWQRVDNYYDAGWFVRLWRVTPELAYQEQKPGLHQQQYPHSIKSIEKTDLVSVIHYGFASDKSLAYKYLVYRAHGQSGWALERLLDESALELRKIPKELFPPDLYINDEQPLQRSMQEAVACTQLYKAEVFKPRISIICLIYKSTEWLEFIYNQVKKYTDLSDKEFFFVANDANNEVLDYLEQNYIPYFVWNNSEGQRKEWYINNVYRAWNFGAQKANGDYLLFINSDMAFTPEWFNNLFSKLNGYNCVASRLVESGKMLSGKYGINRNFGRTTADYNEKGFLEFAESISENTLSDGGLFMPLLIKKEFFLSVGGYPEGNIKPGSDIFNPEISMQGENCVSGDVVLMQKLSSIGISHQTAFDSIVYHFQCGEMDSVPYEQNKNKNKTRVIIANDYLTGRMGEKTMWGFLLEALPNSAGVDMDILGTTENFTSKASEYIKLNFPEDAIVIQNATFIDLLSENHFTVCYLQDNLRAMERNSNQQEANLKHADLLVTNSKLTALSYPDYDFDIIPIGVDGNLFKPDDKKKLRFEFNLPDKKTGIFVGDFSEVKGWSKVKSLIENHSEIFWILVSKDDSSYEAPNVNTFNRISQELLSKLLNCADFFILGSPVETQCLAAIEACLCDLPVIMHNTGIFADFNEAEKALVGYFGEDFETGLNEIYSGNFEPRGMMLRKGLTVDGMTEKWRQLIAKARLLQESKNVAYLENSAPLFTVVVPTFNQAQFLGKALDSLLDQTFQNWEAVIVNDGSTDDTPDVMNKYKSIDRRFRFYHKENGGVSSALNVGIQKARGQWICWLSSDDWFETDKLETHYNAIRENPEIKFFQSHWYVYFQDTDTKVAPNLWLATPPKEFQVSRFFWANYVHGNSIAINRTVFDKVGLFDESLRQGQDFDMWLRITAEFPAHYIDKRTCVTRIHSGQTTNSFFEGGVLDSTRSLINFINENSFEQFFPFVNFRDTQSYALVANEIVYISSKPDAFLYRCGFTTALAEKTLEWISTTVPKHIRPSLYSYLEKIVGDYLKEVQNENVKKVLRKFLDTKKTIYRKHDFIDDTIGQVKNLIMLGDQKQARAVEFYLQKITEANAPESASTQKFAPQVLGFPRDNNYSTIEPENILSWYIQPGNPELNAIHHEMSIKCNECGSKFNLRFEYEMKENPSTYEFICPSCKNGYSYCDKNLDEDFVEFNKHRARKVEAGNFNKNKVVFLIADGSTVGGGSKVIFKYAELLGDLGVNVSIYSFSPKPAWADIRCRYNQIKDEAQLKHSEFEMLVVFSVFDIPKVLNTVPLNKVVHLCQGYEGYHFGRDYEELREDKYVLTKLHAIPVKNISVSTHLVELFKTKFGRVSYYIPNSVNHNIFSLSTHWQDREKTLLFIGNPLHHLKGFQFLAAALRGIQNSNFRIDGLKLQIVMGFIPDDPEKRRCQLEEETSCEVELHFKLTSEQVANLMKKVSAVVVTSWYEGFSLPALEAMACGTPVVTTKNMGAESFCIDKFNAFTVSYGDMHSFLPILLSLLNKQIDINKLLENAYKTSLEYSETIFLKSFIESFEELLNFQFDPEKAGKLLSETAILSAEKPIQNFSNIEKNSSSQIGKNATRLFLSIAENYLNRREFHSAEENIKKAVDSYTEDDQDLSLEIILNIAGNICLANNNLEEAQQYFERELTENPNSSSACLGLGQVFYASEQLEAAKTMFEWALRNDASNENALKSLAEVNEQLGLEINHMTAVE